MSEISKNWTMTDATAGLEGAARAMSQGGFELIAAGALLYVRGVYWETPKLSANDVTDMIHRICEGLNYGRSSRYQLASAALKVARALQRKWGQPDAAKERNVAWVMLQEAPSFADAVAMMVSEIRTTYSVHTLAALHAALHPSVPKAAVRKPLADRVVKTVQKEIDDGTLQRGEVQATVIAMIAAFLTPDDIAAMLPQLTARLTATPVAAAA